MSIFDIRTGKNFLRQPYPKPPFIVDPLVPTTGITLLFGPPSSGKSTLLWTMADAIRDGTPFLGKYPTTKALTMFISVDMPAHSLHHRFKLGGYEPRFTVNNVSNSFNITTLKQKDPRDFERLRRRARRYDVIMIDALAKITSGMSLKDEWVPDMVINSLRELFPHQAVVLIHHSRKQSTDQNGYMPAHREDALGSQMWMALCQSELQLSLKKDHTSHFEMVKSQVADMEPGIDIFVDELGCKVVEMNTHLANQYVRDLLMTEQALSKLHNGYNTMKISVRVPLIAQTLGKDESTIWRWIKRAKYKFI